MEDKQKFISILTKAKILFDDIECHQITTGGNNRTFHVSVKNKKFIIKQYFKHVNDPRDRLEAEYSFLDYAQVAAPGWTPKPIFKDDADSLAVYEFIEGKNFSINDLSEMQVLLAARFFKELNTGKSRPLAAKLPLASEACFSINSHADLIKKRLKSLSCIEGETVEDRAALAISRELSERFNNIIDFIKVSTQRLGIDAHTELLKDECCVSPSDFGFHNALIAANNTPKFLDFEYAGWDDPAKMICDFFSQLSLPVPIKYFDDFTHECISTFPAPEQIISRSRLLMPLYKIKWCCIALNVFLPVNLARRKFANNTINERQFKSNQIEKSRALLVELGEFKHGIH